MTKKLLHRTYGGDTLGALRPGLLARIEKEEASTTAYDAHGQPIVRRYYTARISDRAVDELVGLSRGVIADGVVTRDEAQFLARWIDHNRHIRDRWPANVLYARVREMLADGVLDSDETRELLELLSEITGEGLPVASDARSLSTQLPFTEPPPEIEFRGRRFCLTGRFIYGSRKECQQEIIARGGEAQARPTKKTDFLVIGHIGSEAWIHSTHGRKIERAVELRSAGQTIHIVSEQHWVQFVAA